MSLHLSRSIAFFDLETTGLNISRDRIVEIAIVKVNPDGSREELLERVNPGIPIPPDSTAVHGISDQDVADKPIFSKLAKKVIDFIGDADLAGYNSNKFDIPFLLEELLNAGSTLDMNGRKTVDVQTIFHKMEQRTLSAAYRFYCNKELDNAHSAASDANATLQVLEAQLARYPDLQNDIAFLEEFSRAGKNKVVDFVGRLAENENGELMYNFGKHAGKTVKEIFQSEPGYHRWMLDNDFPLITKQILRKFVEQLPVVKQVKKEIPKPKQEAISPQQLNELQNKFKKL